MTENMQGQIPDGNGAIPSPITDIGQGGFAPIDNSHRIGPDHLGETIAGDMNRGVFVNRPEYGDFGPPR